MKRIASFLMAFVFIMSFALAYLPSLPSKAAEATYVQELKDAGFPESYVRRLSKLHDQHPTWQFKPVLVSQMKSAYTWDYIINQEMEPERNLIYKSFSSSDYASSDTLLESGSWRQASEATVEFFMDPRNFLDEKNIFMFETLKSADAVYTVDDVNYAVSGTFMANTTLENGKTYAQNFYDIGKATGVSALHLATRVKQEQGTDGSSPLISGKCGDTLWQYYQAGSNSAPSTGYTEADLKAYNGYYNYFNIGASGTGYFNIYLSGMKESKEGNWTTRYAAIQGGAQKIYNKYVSDYQHTLYFQKFNVHPSSGRNFWGQYMQNVSAAYSEGRSIQKTYADNGLLDSAFTFEIPVYSGMPAACPDPGSSFEASTDMILSVAGDVNDDISVDSKDVALLRRFITKWSVEINTITADVNIDEAIDSKDTTLIRRYIAGWDVELKLPENENGGSGGNTSSGEIDSDGIINIPKLPTSGTNPNVGGAVLNYNNDGTNSSSIHSIGVVDLSKYKTVEITYSTAPNATMGVIRLKTASKSLQGAPIPATAGWDSPMQIYLDLVPNSENEELFIEITEGAAVISKIRFYPVDGGTGSGGTGSGVVDGNGIINIPELPSSGTNSNAGGTVLNFNNDGTNSSSIHSIGVVDLSKYKTVEITYSTAPNAAMGVIRLKTASKSLQGAPIPATAGWDSTSEIYLDCASNSENEELFIEITEGAAVISKIKFYPVDGSTDSGDTGDSGSSGYDEIEIDSLATSGLFTEAGFAATQKFLNFESGGENSSTEHSIGIVDLSKYKEIIITYGNDGSLLGKEVATVVLKTASTDLTSAILSGSSGWKNSTTAVFDVSDLENNEELFMALSDAYGGFAVSKIELVPIDDNTNDSGNTGDNENTGDSGNTGDNENTGDSGNTGDNENTGDSGNTGDNENTGDSGNTGDNENTGDSGNTGDEVVGVIDENGVIDLTALLTAGTNSNVTGTVLNFNNDDENSNSKHSIGVVDLSKYRLVEIKFTNPADEAIGAIRLKTGSQQIVGAIPAETDKAAGWDSTGAIYLDFSSTENTEMFIEVASGNVVVTGIKFYPVV